MAMFDLVQRSVWILICIILYALLICEISGDQLFDSGLNLQKNPCDVECNCYSWSSINSTQRYDRFTVNCSGVKFGLFQGFDVRKPIPINTTDLVVTGSLFGKQTSVVLRSLNINYVPYENLNANRRLLVHPKDLNSETIDELDENAFRNLIKLQRILIADNFIQKVGQNTFNNLNQVNLINMSKNFIWELQPDTFYGVPNLEILDVSYNWLNTLPWENISHLLLLKELHLTGNPWNCSCQMMSILKLNRSLLIGTQAECVSPQSLSGKLLKDLNIQTFSHCFVSENYSKTRKITLFCIIISCLYICIKYGYRDKRIIRYNRSDPLDQFGSVYKGELKDGRQAAVKVIKKNGLWKDACKELKILLHLSKARPHPNIVQYLWAEPETHFTYLLALELCSGNLMTAVMEGINGFDNITVVDAQNYFLQLTSGICFLHENKIQHRDIKPRNILWKRGVNGIVLLIADFDMGHFSQEMSSHRVMYGTLGWTSPELRDLQQPRSDAVDIFSLGCVFYFILTGGHPFGAISNPEECQQNIMSPEREVSLDALTLHYRENISSAIMSKDLIGKMICSKASDRIEDRKIEKHPFLLKKEEIAHFLTTIGEYMKEKKDEKIKDFQKRLEENSHMVFDGKWFDRLHPRAKSDLNKFSKKGNDKICCLLKGVRDKIVHFSDLSMELREIYMGDKFGVIEYYMNLFPNLVQYTYNVLEKSEIENFTY